VDERIRAGAHEVRCEADTGIVYLVHFSPINAGEAVPLNDAISKFAEYAPPGAPVFLLVDNRNAGPIASGARKILSQSPVRKREMYISHYGASFAIRAIINLMMKALSFHLSSCT